MKLFSVIKLIIYTLQIIEMNAEVKKIIVKKDKVKVKRSNPLKGAIIDIDYDTGLKEVFGDNEDDIVFQNISLEKAVEICQVINEGIEDEQKQLDLFSKEYNNNEDEFEDDKQDREYYEKKQKLLKDLEELEKKELMRKGAKKYKSHIVEMLEANIKSNENAIKKFQDENLQYQQQLNDLEPIELDADIMDYLEDNFSEEVNELIEKNTYKHKPIKTKKKKSPIVDEKEWNCRKKYDRETQFKQIPNEVVIYLSYKGNKTIFKKTDKGLEQDGKTFETLNQAGKDFHKSLGVDRTFNAWKEFKIDMNGKPIDLDTYVRLMGF